MPKQRRAARPENPVEAAPGSEADGSRTRLCPSGSTTPSSGRSSRIQSARGRFCRITFRRNTSAGSTLIGCRIRLRDLQLTEKGGPRRPTRFSGSSFERMPRNGHSLSLSTSLTLMPERLCSLYASWRGFGWQRLMKAICLAAGCLMSFLSSFSTARGTGRLRVRPRISSKPVPKVGNSSSALPATTFLSISRRFRRSNGREIRQLALELPPSRWQVASRCPRRPRTCWLQGLSTPSLDIIS